MRDDDSRWAALLDAAPRARRAAARIVGDGPDAEDCVSAAIEAALSATACDSPASWLVVVARRRAVDITRSRRSEDRAWRHSRAHRPASDAADFTEEIDDREAARWLATEARSLPHQTRRVLDHLGDGASAASIADELGMSRRAVESHILRARRHLRAAWMKSIAALIMVAAGARRFVHHAGPPAAATLTAASLFVAVEGAGPAGT
ncbi:MAG: sigma-70 family RNA polymerase sigma factor, partial [Frankiaceae bacterium]|nr:sigma-70 family RNA polymerase sigma factor [Frankiaceae bacterium]MBV9369732.1 sigma-70 family RNA polymerase sigma factor [Frankiales bacterium]